MMIGTSVMPRSIRSASEPSRSGRPRSSTTRSGVSAATRRSASSAVPTACTACPRSVSERSIAPRTTWSSSTRSTVATSRPYCPWQVESRCDGPANRASWYDDAVHPVRRCPAGARPGQPGRAVRRRRARRPVSSSRAGGPTDLAAGRLPPTPWEWTDDTEMACSVARRTRRLTATSTGTGWPWPSPSGAEPYRGYGPGAVTILRLIRTGTPWPAGRRVRLRRAGLLRQRRGDAGRARSARDFADSTSARRRPGPAPRAEVTHAHPEGIAGAVAVAVAAALAARARLDGRPRRPRTRLLAAVAAALDPGAEVHRGVHRAAGLLGRAVDRGASPRSATAPGSPPRTPSPFTLWVAATHLGRLSGGDPRRCVRGRAGTCDTTAAIVGAVVPRTPGSAPGRGARRVAAARRAATNLAPLTPAPALPARLALPALALAVAATINSASWKLGRSGGGMPVPESRVDHR